MGDSAGNRRAYPEGWTGHVGRLSALAGNLEQQRRLGYDGFSSGWAIGTQGWRQELAQQHAALALVPGLGAAQAHALREARWRQVLEEQLKAAGRMRDETLRAPKTAPWKLELAQSARDRAGATMAWLVREVGLGAEGTARSLMSKRRRGRIQQYSA